MGRIAAVVAVVFTLAACGGDATGPTEVDVEVDAPRFGHTTNPNANSADENGNGIICVPLSGVVARGGTTDDFGTPPRCPVGYGLVDLQHGPGV